VRFRIECCVLFLLFAISACDAQSGPVKFPTGLRIPATLKASLSSARAKAGDLVKLDVFVAVHGKDGKLLIPAHATLSGVVTQAAPFHGSGQPALLAFAISQVEWKGGSGTLDAAVFGVLGLSDFRRPGSGIIDPRIEYELEQPMRGSTTQVELVEDVRAATLRHQASLDLVDNRTVSADPGGPATVVPSSKIMELKLSTDPAVRTVFTSDKHDVELPKEFMVVLLNGMKVVQ
jgi:hypothetical protein